MKIRWITGVLVLTVSAVLAQEPPKRPKKDADARKQKDDGFLESAPKVGSVLPSVAVTTPEGKPFHTDDLRGGYTVLTFGCLT